MKAAGHLTSRDDAEKFYVQGRMRESGLAMDGAIAFVANMKKSGRFQADVY